MNDFDKIINTNNDRSKSLRLFPFGSTHGASKGFAAWWKKFDVTNHLDLADCLIMINASFTQLERLQPKPKVSIFRIYGPLGGAIGLNETPNDPL